MSDDVMGRRCRWTGRPRPGLPGTGRAVCLSPPGRSTPPGWWVLWDGQDTPRWEPAGPVQVDGTRHPDTAPPATRAPDPVGPPRATPPEPRRALYTGLDPVFASALNGAIRAVAKADQ